VAVLLILVGPLWLPAKEA